MRRAVLLTGHFAQQKRRGSMLWVSEHLQRQGWHVTHVTVGYSWLSYLRRDVRLRALGYRPKRGVVDVSRTLTMLFGLPHLHPFKTKSRRIDALLEPLWTHFISYWQRHLPPHLNAVDLILCESGPPALLAPILAKAAPNTPRVYRVNDDIRLLNAPPVLVRAEVEHAPLFTRISTASPHLALRFADHPNVTLDPMGIPHDRLNISTADPYHAQTPGKIAVCAGTTQFDLPALRQVATENPNWQIHVLGRLRSAPPTLPNVIWHGEQSFETTLAHIAHADIGLAPYLDRPGVAYQATNSNRILLYRHFGLPILGPDRLCHPDIPSLIGYGTPQAAFRCETFGRRPEPIPDWSELAQSLSQNGATEPPNDVSIDPDRIEKLRVKTVPALASNA